MPRLTQLDRFWQIHRIGRTNRNPIPQRTEAKPDDPGKGRGVSGSGNAVATVITDEGPVEFHPDRGWCSRRRHIQRSRKRTRIGGQNRIVPADVGGLFDHPGHQGNRLNKPLTRLYFLNRGGRAHLFFRRFRMSCTPNDSTAPAFLTHFQAVEDPRQEGKVLYSLEEILLLFLCGVISGADGWTPIALYGQKKLELVNQHSTVTHFPHPTVTHLQEGDRWGGAAAGPARRDDPSQSFLCRSSLVAFPSLPDEKKLL